jgi:predicted dehydrogenase
MPDRLRVGLAGAGWVAGYHLEAYRVLGSIVEVVAIADPEIGRAEERAREFGIEKTYADVNAMLERTEIDILDVATPRETHVAATFAGISAGLPVLCQKPFAPDFPTAELFYRSHPDALIMVHDNWRFRPHYRTLGNWLRDGLIGAVTKIECRAVTSGLIADEPGNYPALLRQPMLAGLRRMLLMEILLHHIDTLRFLFGEFAFESCAGARRCPAILGEDRVEMHLRTDSGAQVLVLGDFCAPGAPPLLSDHVVVTGESGTIELQGSGLELNGRQARVETIDLGADYRQSYVDAISHFINQTRLSAPYETSLSDHLETLRLVEMGYSAMQESGLATH